MLDKLLHKTFGLPYRLSKPVDEGDGPVVVFLHGLASSHHVWNSVIPRVSKTNRCISFDLLGFGGSPRPDWPAYSVTDHIRAIHRSISALSLNSPIILVGHSMGSILAVAYAETYPKEVASLVLCSLPIYTSQVSSGESHRSIDAIYSAIYRRMIVNKKLTLYEAAVIKRLMKYSEEFEASEANWRSTSGSLENTILSQTTLDVADKLTQPICIIVGRADLLVIKRNIETFATRAKNAKIVYINATHNINGAFINQIVSEINTLSGRTHSVNTHTNIA
jgi:pimeloyl-ACP methyl ester carboxylesterase